MRLQSTLYISFFVTGMTLVVGCSNNKSFTGIPIEDPNSINIVDAENFDLSFRDAQTNIPIPDSGVSFSLGTAPRMITSITNTGTKSVTLTKGHMQRAGIMTATKGFQFSSFASFNGLMQILGVGDNTRSDVKRFGKASFLGCWTTSDRTAAIDINTDSFALPTGGVCDFQFRIIADSPINDNYDITLSLGGVKKQKSLTVTALPLVQNELRMDSLDDDYFPLTSTAANVTRPFQFRKSIQAETSPVTFSIEQSSEALLTVTTSPASCSGTPGEMCNGLLSFSYTGTPPTQDVADYPVTLVAKEGNTVITKRTILVQIFKDAIPIDQISKQINATKLEKGRYTHEQDLFNQEYNRPMAYVIGDGKLWYSRDQGVSFHEVLKATSDGLPPSPFTGVTAYATAFSIQELIVAHDAGVHMVNIRSNTMYPIAGLPEDDQEIIAMTSRVPALDEFGVGVGEGQGGNPLTAFHNRIFMLSKKGNIYVALRAPGDAGVYAIERAYADMDVIREQILALRSPAATELPEMTNLYYVGGGELILVSKEGLIGLKTDDNTTIVVNQNIFSANAKTRLGPLLYSGERNAALPSGCSATQIKSVIRSFTSDGLHLGLATTNDGTNNDCTFDIRRKFMFFGNVDFELLDRPYEEKFDSVRVLNHNSGDFQDRELLTYLSAQGYPYIVLVTRYKVNGDIILFPYSLSNDESPTADATPIQSAQLAGDVAISAGGLALFQHQSPSSNSFHKLILDSVPIYVPNVTTTPEVLTTSSIFDYFRTSANQSRFTFRVSIPHQQVQTTVDSKTLAAEFKTYPDDDANTISSDVLNLINTKSIADFPNYNYSVALLGGTGGDITKPNVAFLNSDRTALLSGTNVLEGALVPNSVDHNSSNNKLYVGVDDDGSHDVGGIYTVDTNDHSTVERIVHLENPAYGIDLEKRKVNFIKLYNNDTLFISVIGKVLILTNLQSFDEGSLPSGLTIVDTSSVGADVTITSAEFLAENGGNFVVTFSNGAVKLMDFNGFVTDHTVLNNSNECLFSITTPSQPLAFAKARNFDNKTWYTFYSNTGVCVYVYNPNAESPAWTLHAGPIPAPGGDIKRAILESDVVVVYPTIGAPKLLQIPHAFDYPNN